MISIWSFDTTNSAYLKLFEDEFIIENDNLLKFNTYKLQTNLIYQVSAKTQKSDFIKDITNLNELDYKLYSSNGNELLSSDYVSTGSYIDVNKGNNRKDKNNFLSCVFFIQSPLNSL